MTLAPVGVDDEVARGGCMGLHVVGAPVVDRVVVLVLWEPTNTEECNNGAIDLLQSRLKLKITMTTDADRAGV